ncbi:hypothetical protein E2C01_012001 [Portunus trituberculatus]|uniref:Uncharacterized protein n=1 Tax=Portunus trituberculatus TaxID=210409 RepID=A0A5B7DCC2_PORTR|nr:hypothetical protein [Portunus trituberculatus]
MVTDCGVSGESSDADELQHKDTEHQTLGMYPQHIKLPSQDLDFNTSTHSTSGARRDQRITLMLPQSVITASYTNTASLI